MDSENKLNPVENGVADVMSDEEAFSSVTEIGDDEDDEATIEEQELEELEVNSNLDELSELKRDMDMPLSEIMQRYYSNAAVHEDLDDENSFSDIIGSAKGSIMREDPSTNLIVSSNEISKNLSDTGQKYFNIINIKPEQERETETPDCSGYAAYFGEENCEENDSLESDPDYLPSDYDTNKRMINVGGQYQAVIPDLLPSTDNGTINVEVEEDRLLWRPPIENIEAVEQYLIYMRQLKIIDKKKKIESSGRDQLNSLSKNDLCGSGIDDMHLLPMLVPQLPLYVSTCANSNVNSATINCVNVASLLSDTKNSSDIISDDEEALHLLLQCNFDTQEAIRRGAVDLGESLCKNTIWSEMECENFENGFKMFGKSFSEIQTMVKTRSVAEIISFYYIWKKSSRYDNFIIKYGDEKKKQKINRNSKNLMDLVMDDDLANIERLHGPAPSMSIAEFEQLFAYSSSTSSNSPLHYYCSTVSTVVTTSIDSATAAATITAVTNTTSNGVVDDQLIAGRRNQMKTTLRRMSTRSDSNNSVSVVATGISPSSSSSASTSKVENTGASNGDSSSSGSSISSGRACLRSVAESNIIGSQRIMPPPPPPVSLFSSDASDLSLTSRCSSLPINLSPTHTCTATCTMTGRPCIKGKLAYSFNASKTLHYSTPPSLTVCDQQHQRRSLMVAESAKTTVVACSITNRSPPTDDLPLTESASADPKRSDRKKQRRAIFDAREKLIPSRISSTTINRCTVIEPVPVTYKIKFSSLDHSSASSRRLFRNSNRYYKRSTTTIAATIATATTTTDANCASNNSNIVSVNKKKRQRTEQTSSDVNKIAAAPLRNITTSKLKLSNCNISIGGNNNNNSNNNSSMASPQPATILLKSSGTAANSDIKFKPVETTPSSKQVIKRSPTSAVNLSVGPDKNVSSVTHSLPTTTTVQCAIKLERLKLPLDETDSKCLLTASDNGVHQKKRKLSSVEDDPPSSSSPANKKKKKLEKKTLVSSRKRDKSKATNVIGKKKNETKKKVERKKKKNVKKNPVNSPSEKTKKAKGKIAVKKKNPKKLEKKKATAKKRTTKMNVKSSSAASAGKKVVDKKKPPVKRKQPVSTKSAAAQNRKATTIVTTKKQNKASPATAIVERKAKPSVKTANSEKAAIAKKPITKITTKQLVNKERIGIINENRRSMKKTRTQPHAGKEIPEHRVINRLPNKVSHHRNDNKAEEPVPAAAFAPPNLRGQLKGDSSRDDQSETRNKQDTLTRSRRKKPSPLSSTAVIVQAVANEKCANISDVIACTSGASSINGNSSTRANSSNSGKNVTRTNRPDNGNNKKSNKVSCLKRDLAACSASARYSKRLKRHITASGATVGSNVRTITTTASSPLPH